MNISLVPYQNDPVETLKKLETLSHPFLFDSADHKSELGRYDILGVEPSFYKVIRIEARNDFHQVRAEILQQLDSICSKLSEFNKEKPSVSLPFIGGVMMSLSYPSGNLIHHVAQPDAIIGWYPQAIVTDHVKQESYLVALADANPEVLRQIEETLSADKSSPDKCQTYIRNTLFQKPDLEPNASYCESIESIHNYILSGDAYQVNFSHAVRGEWSPSLSPLDLYSQLRQTTGGPFSLFVPYENGAIMSASPERFFKVNQGGISSSPIKGTLPRLDNAEDDGLQKQRLHNSEKDRAENLMIVDLIRNDLGKVCQVGSIKVPKLFEVESHKLVHHLVSHVQGDLKPEASIIDILEALWPGGSITGAPKKRSMEIIEELEKAQRGFYCGSAGYVSVDGQMDFNILIRTLITDGQRIECRAGGGIVADSKIFDEYQETLDKVGKLIGIEV